MKKFVCYDDGNSYVYINAEVEPYSDTYIKYIGLFLDGVYGTSFARPKHVFDIEDEAKDYCKNNKPERIVGINEGKKADKK
jgi:hypothetical protein